jgi:hypothetical protein
MVSPYRDAPSIALGPQATSKTVRSARSALDVSAGSAVQWSHLGSWLSSRPSSAEVEPSPIYPAVHVNRGPLMTTKGIGRDIVAA